MEKVLCIITLDHGIITLRIPDPKKYNLEYIKDEVESITNVISPHQVYYSRGKEVESLISIESSPDAALEMIEDNSMSVIRYLLRFRGRVYPIYVSNYEKKFLLCLKLRIEKKFSSLGIDCPFDSQTLKINSEELPSSLSLSEIPYNTEIDLDLNSFIPQRSRITTFDLTDLKESNKHEKTTLVNRGNKYEVKIDERASKWRKVLKGFSLQCYCRNRECEARNRTVVINLGFGVFSVNSMKNKSNCPLCGELCQEFVTGGFYFACWKFRGIANETSVTGEEKTWNQYYVWREILDEWSELRFSVRPNEN